MWTSHKQKKGSYSLYGAAVLAAADRDDTRFFLKDLCLELFSQKFGGIDTWLIQKRCLGVWNERNTSQTRGISRTKIFSNDAWQNSFCEPWIRSLDS